MSHNAKISHDFFDEYLRGKTRIFWIPKNLIPNDNMKLLIKWRKDNEEVISLGSTDKFNQWRIQLSTGHESKLILSEQVIAWRPLRY